MKNALTAQAVKAKVAVALNMIEKGAMKLSIASGELFDLDRNDERSIEIYREYRRIVDIIDRARDEMESFGEGE